MKGNNQELLVKMNKWKTYKLGEIVDVLGDGIHGTPIYNEVGDYYFINGNNLGEGYIKIKENTLKVDEKEYLKHKKNLTNRTLLLSINGTLGNVAKYRGEPCILGKSACYLNISESCERDFIYYIMISPLFRRDLENMATGTTIKNVSLKALRNYEISLPPLAEQKRIADILGAIDDKIELNRRINANLEQQAQALYKSWFVDFEFPNEEGKPYKSSGGKMQESELGLIPKGWNIDKLGNKVVIKRGGSPRPIQDFLALKGLRWLKISDATAEPSPYIYKIKEFIKEEGLSKTVFLNKGELVLSNSATPGLPKLLGLDTCIHDGWLYFPKSDFSKEYLFELFLFEREKILSQANGSVFSNLKTDILKALTIIVPQENVLNRFQNIIGQIFRSIQQKQEEIISLTTLRDTLLPELMSGEIKA